MKKPKFNATLEEVFDYCSIPNSIVERKELLQDMADDFPGIAKFIEHSFGTPTKEFLDVLQDFPEQRPTSKVPNRQMMFFSDFLLDALPKLKDTSKGSSLRAKLIQEMDFLEPRDFKLLLPALRGEFVPLCNKKINEVVLEMAFPHAFPNQ